MNRLLLLIVISTFLFSSCKKSEKSGPINTQISGLVEKGPFVKGSKVTLTELDKDLNPTGKTYTTETQNDQGFFKLKNIELTSPYVQVSVTGIYFNEITGRLSDSQISLGAYADVKSEYTVNVNILTHIEQQRVKQLITQQKKSFSAAKKQAQTELLSAFYIKDNPGKSSEKISITSNDHSANILLSISSVLLNGVSSHGQLIDRINSIAGVIASQGELDATTNSLVFESIKTLNFRHIKRNVVARYEAIGKEIKIGDLASSFTVAIVAPDLIKTYEEYLVLLRGANGSFAQYLESFYLIEALYSNSVTSGITLPGTLSQIYNHTFYSDNSNISELFGQSYQGIQRYTLIADHASTGTNTEIGALEYIIYPYLANIYWSLMELWGDVPFVTPINYINPVEMRIIQRSAMNDIRDDLLQKLESSVQNIEFGKGSLQVDKAFPLSMLVRLSLQAKDYSKAKLYSEQLINSNTYELSPVSELHSTSKESIIGYQKDAFLDERGGARNPNYLSFANKGDFIHIIRYTEIILAAAEASIKLGDRTSAQTYLNKVRVRNGKEVLNSSNNEEVLAAILLEIQEDLGKEGVWFSAMKRNGIAMERLNIAEHKLLFPIPARELQLNTNLIQNPGY